MQGVFREMRTRYLQARDMTAGMMILTEEVRDSRSEFHARVLQTKLTLVLLGPTMRRCNVLQQCSTKGKQRESLSRKLGLSSDTGMISPVHEYVYSECLKLSYDFIKLNGIHDL